jgi:hypothetical protein
VNHPKLTRPQLFKATVLVGGDDDDSKAPRLLSVFAYAKDFATAEKMADQASGGIARGILIEEGPDTLPTNVEPRQLHGVSFYVESPRRMPR